MEGVPLLCLFPQASRSGRFWRIPNIRWWSMRIPSNSRSIMRSRSEGMPQANPTPRDKAVYNGLRVWRGALESPSCAQVSGHCEVIRSKTAHSLCCFPPSQRRCSTVQLPGNRVKGPVADIDR